MGLKTRLQWIKQHAQWIKDSKKAKKDKVYAKKSFLGEVRGEWFLNIFLLDLDTISVLVATVFSLQIFLISHIIYAHFADPGPQFVDYAGHQTPSTVFCELWQPRQHCSGVFFT